MPTLLELAQAQVKRDALNDILATGLLAGGLGVGFRALQSRQNLFSGTPAADESDASLPLSQPLQVQMPIYDSKQDKKTSDKNVKALNKSAGWWKEFFGGGFANSKEQIPYYYPGMIGAGLAGGWGGYHLADRLIQKKKKQDVQSELDAARQEYQKALLSNFDPKKIEMETALAKSSAEETVGDKLGKQLNKLASLMGVHDGVSHEVALTKAANALERALGQMTGMYGMYAIPAGMLSGIAAYNYAQSRSGEKVLEEAIRRRNRERAAMRAPDISFNLSPVKVDRTGVIQEKVPDPDSKPSPKPSGIFVL